MRKLMKVFFIALGVIAAAYGIYFILGRPAIPMPTFTYTVSQGNQFYDWVIASGENTVAITWSTNGEIEALAGNGRLVNVTYDTESLGNTLALVSRFILPERIQDVIGAIDRICPLLKVFPKMTSAFFYHIIRLKFTIVIHAE